jgi:hypothetical protein
VKTLLTFPTAYGGPAGEGVVELGEVVVGGGLVGGWVCLVSWLDGVGVPDGEQAAAARLQERRIMMPTRFTNPLYRAGGPRGRGSVTPVHAICGSAV